MNIASFSEAGISVAIGIARDHGVAVEKPVPLRSTNNVVVWLYPAPIVAKIAGGRRSRLDAELKVAREMAVLGAPIVLPAPEMPQEIHARDGFEVTFWRYHWQNPSLEIPARRIAEALRLLHMSLARISPALKASLPRYTQELCAARSLLAGPDTLPALPASDRQLLASMFDRLQVEMNGCACPGERHVLHGSPHSYNVLVVDDALRFIDLETACTGPLEWDLAHIDEEGESGYCSPIDRRLLWNCRAMVSVKTATWCWADADRGDLREHAEWHLGRVKTYITSRELRDGGRTASNPEGVSGKG